MRDFFRMSKYAGMREDLVQAGGGNSSYKISKDKMVIKASGFQLSDVKENEGYAVVNPQIIAEAFMKFPDLNLMTEKDSKKILEDAFIEGPRASIETFLHAMSDRYTLHTHPVVVNILTARYGGMELLQTLFPEAIFVPYATPGVELAKVFFNKIKEKGEMPNMVFLQNHGIVISAKTADDVIELTESVIRKIEEELELDFEKYHRATKLSKLFPEKIVWTVNDIHVINAYRNKKTIWNTAVCPDCVVFLGKKMLTLQNDFEKEIKFFQENYGNPVVVEYCDSLYIIAPSVKKAFEIQSVLSFSAQIDFANRNNQINYLSEQEQNFLLHWEVEKYRRNMK